MARRPGGQTVGQLWNRKRYQNNPYVRGTRNDQNGPRSQYPRRMYRPQYKQRPRTIDDIINGPGIPTEEEVDQALRAQMQPPTQDPDNPNLGTAPINNQPIAIPEHLHGLAMAHRHHYGDEIDILRSKFTRSKEELEKEKFKLIVQSRLLVGRLFWSMKTIPKIERFILGGDIRQAGYSILRDAIAIKKRFYRKNLLESIDIQLDVLRELYRHAYREYPDWVDEKHFDLILRDIDLVGDIVGGLLKTTVC